MQTEDEASTGSDPLKVVADALDPAVKATKDGAERAREAASEAVPAAGEFLSRAAYNTCYAISYGLVFPTMLLVHSIPKDNAVVHGLIDGAQAAKDSVQEMKSKSETLPTV